MIEVKGLEKEFRIHQARPGLTGALRDLFNREYKTVKAVDDISFQVEAGEIFALIGENGAACGFASVRQILPAHAGGRHLSGSFQV